MSDEISYMDNCERSLILDFEINKSTNWSNEKLYVKIESHIKTKLVVLSTWINYDENKSLHMFLYNKYSN